jgi:hypothetical protein
MTPFANNVSVDRRFHNAFLASIIGRRQVAVLVVVALVCWIGTVPAGRGQCSRDTTYTLYTFDGEAAGDAFGYSVSGAGDVNNDGCDDLIVGARENDAGGEDAGRAYVYSGQTGDLLWTFTGEAADDRFGYSVCGAGDVNNDGHADLIVGAPGNDAGGEGAGRAYVYSGQTGDLLWALTGEAALDVFGASVSGAGDMNNDGYADLIVGAPYSSAGGQFAGRAYVYSGQTGNLFRAFTGERAYDLFGWSVSEAGDVDNDGYDDVIIGAFDNDLGGASAGRAYVYSGRTLALLWTLIGQADFDFLGCSVSGARDVDGDGYDDVIVGAYGNDAGGERAGRAYALSGRDGGLFQVFTGEAPWDYLGYWVSGAGDVNNDGYDDVIVGAYGSDAGGTDAGRAYVHSGWSGNLLCTFTGEASGDEFGGSVSWAGDVNNDGSDEVIVGAPHNDAGGNSAGRAYVCACQVEDPIARGDANADGAIDLDDAVYILNYLFKAGPAPFPFDAGDANCDGIIDVRDAVYLLNYLFKGGPPPGCP